MLPPNPLPTKILALLLFTAGAGCSSWLGNPQTTKPSTDGSSESEGSGKAKIEPQPSEDQPQPVHTIPVADKEGKEIGAFAITAVTVQVTQIRLLAAAPFFLDVVVRGPFNFDGLTGKFDPPIPEITIPYGGIKAAQLTIATTTDQNAFELKGTFDAGDVKDLSVTLEETIEAYGVSEDVYDPLEYALVIMSFDLNLNQVFDFSGVENDLRDIMTASIVIDENSSDPIVEGIRNKIKNNLGQSFSFSQKGSQERSAEYGGIIPTPGVVTQPEKAGTNKK